MTRSKLSVFVAAIVLLAWSSAGWAASPTETVQTAIQRVFDESGAGKARAASLEERRVLIRLAAESLFDFRDMARRSLGARFDELSPADQSEFVRLFTNLIALSYMGKVEAYAGEPIHYLGERVDGADASVQSRLVTVKGSQVDVAYRLHQIGDRWSVYDVSVDGVSLVENYRTQFGRMIQRTSFADLLKTLRAKVGS